MDELFFITFNGFGQMFSIINNAIIGLTECETTTVIGLNSVKIYLMISAGIVLGLILLSFTFYVISVDKTLNALWEFLRRRIHKNYINTKQALHERLSNFHNKDSFDTELDTSYHQESTPINFMHSLLYLLKLSVLFVSVAVFFALTSSYFFENIYHYMYYKFDFIYTVIQRRIALTEMLFYVYENEVQGTDKSLSALFPQFDLFTDPAGLYLEAYNTLAVTKKVLRDPNILRLMSPVLEDLIFWTWPNGSVFQLMGTYSAMSFLMLESHFIIFNKEVDSPSVIETYVLETFVQTDSLELQFIIAEIDSENKINIALQDFIDFIICFCIFLIGLYWFYYRPYFNSEKEVLERIMKLIAILPPNQIVYNTNIYNAK